MTNARVTGLRGIELGVTNLDRAAAFYSHVWGLDPVVSEKDTIHLRANGTEHHVVTLRERPKARGLAVAGMPRGSPGMEDGIGRVEPYDVILVMQDGSERLFARYDRVGK